MGYEIKIYAVIEHTDMNWAEEIVSMDLCKCPMNCFTEPAKGRLFAHDGNSVISEDRYGEELKAAPISQVISELNTIAEETHYRRAVIARDLLKSIEEHFKVHGSEKLMVYKFGH